SRTAQLPTPRGRSRRRRGRRRLPSFGAGRGPCRRGDPFRRPGRMDAAGRDRPGRRRTGPGGRIESRNGSLSPHRAAEAGGRPPVGFRTTVTGTLADIIPPSAPPDRRGSIATALLRTARPRQWLKNVLVFAAPGAAGVLFHGHV